MQKRVLVFNYLNVLFVKGLPFFFKSVSSFHCFDSRFRILHQARFKISFQSGASVPDQIVS